SPAAAASRAHCDIPPPHPRSRGVPISRAPGAPSSPPRGDPGASPGCAAARTPPGSPTRVVPPSPPPVLTSDAPLGLCSPRRCPPSCRVSRHGLVSRKVYTAFSLFPHLPVIPLHRLRRQPDREEPAGDSGGK